MYTKTTTRMGKIVKIGIAKEKHYPLSLSKKRRPEDVRKTDRIKKARSRFRGICLSTFFSRPNTYLLLLTFKKENKRRDLDFVRKCVESFARAARHKYPNMSYVYVTEKSAKGYYHCHFLCSGADYAFLKEKWKKQNGYISHKSVRESIVDVEKIANYMTKDYEKYGKLIDKHTYHVTHPVMIKKESEIYPGQRIQMETELEDSGCIVGSYYEDKYGGKYMLGFSDKSG